jgi:hypothetical protein
MKTFDDVWWSGGSHEGMSNDRNMFALNRARIESTGFGKQSLGEGEYEQVHLLQHIREMCWNCKRNDAVLCYQLFGVVSGSRAEKHDASNLRRPRGSTATPRMSRSEAFEWGVIGHIYALLSQDIEHTTTFQSGVDQFDPETRPGRQRLRRPANLEPVL